MGKRYYWLKLKEDFFDSKRIKKLRRLAGGDTFTIIYLKMQLKAMKTDGTIIFDGLEKTFAEELALDLDEEPENVQVTLSYLISCGLVETSDNIRFFMPYSVENTGSEASSTQRVRDHRERIRSEKNSLVLQCNNFVTERKREEIEKEIEIEKELSLPQKVEKKQEQFDYEAYRGIYNSACTSLPSCRKMTDKRKRSIRSFSKEFTIEDWREICARANGSAFLSGKNDTGWKADIDFLLRTDKAAKVLEGAYQGISRRQSDCGNPFLEILREEEAKNEQAGNCENPVRAAGIIP